MFYFVFPRTSQITGLSLSTFGDPSWHDVFAFYLDGRSYHITWRRSKSLSPLVSLKAQFLVPFCSSSIPILTARPHNIVFHVTAMLMTLNSSSCHSCFCTDRFTDGCSSIIWSCFTEKPSFCASLEIRFHIKILSSPWRTLSSYLTKHETLVVFWTTSHPSFFILLI